MNPRTHSLLPLLALLAAAGCAPDRMSLEPYGLCVMPDTCKFGSKCDAYAIGPISYNSAGPTELVMGIEVRNQTPNNANLSVGRVNSNDAHVTGYTVKYGSGGPGTLTRYDGSQAIPAAGTAVVWVSLLTPGAPLGAYVADISFIGYFDNGSEFQTEPFQIGLKVGATSWTCPKAGDVVKCPPGLSSGSTSPQNFYACGTP